MTQEVIFFPNSDDNQDKSRGNNREPSDYHYDPRFKKKRLTDAKEMVLYMVPRYLSEEELQNLARNVVDPVWRDERALTSLIAQRYLGVGFFHSRRPGINPLLKKYQLPFKLVQITHPEGLYELYFLVFIGQGEPPTLAEVTCLFAPSECDDNEDISLLA